MVGAPTINCTNVYPNLERWKLVDEDGKYEEVYNRYAHSAIKLQNEETSFELPAPDAFSIYLNVDDLKVLDVKYILTTNDLENYNSDKISFELINKENMLKIYKIN